MNQREKGRNSEQDGELNKKGYSSELRPQISHRQFKQEYISKCHTVFPAFVTFRGLALYREKLSECTLKNDEFNSLAKMTNSINCTKFRNN